MKTTQNHQVIMLPTENESKIIKINNNLSLYEFDVKQITGRSYTAQHLYILSDEEIKVGDYISDGYIVWKWNDDSSLLGRKKVIATTDTSLKITIVDRDTCKPIDSGIMHKYKNTHLPQPSQGFIKKYIEKYNQGNIITEVNVEYEINNRCCGMCDGINDLCVTDMYCKSHNTLGCEICYGVRGEIKTLKLSENNIISILPIKTSYTREEVLAFGRKCFNYGIKCESGQIDLEEIGKQEEWFKNNLQ